MKEKSKLYKVQLNLNLNLNLTLGGMIKQYHAAYLILQPDSRG